MGIDEPANTRNIYRHGGSRPWQKELDAAEKLLGYDKSSAVNSDLPRDVDILTLTVLGRRGEMRIVPRPHAGKDLCRMSRRPLEALRPRRSGE
jgi:hypothetical protein